MGGHAGLVGLQVLQPDCFLEGRAPGLPTQLQWSYRRRQYQRYRTTGAEKSRSEPGWLRLQGTVLLPVPLRSPPTSSPLLGGTWTSS
jgi:hypothetical protein